MTEWQTLPATISDGLLCIGGHRVMHAAEHPIMAKFAEPVCAGHGDILEMGFGLGVCASIVQSLNVRSHTIIEGHPEIARRARVWADDKSSVRILEGTWQDVLPALTETFDGVIYDSYEFTDTDRIQDFIRQATRLLRPGGVFSGWLSDDPPTLEIMTALLDSFDEVTFTVFRDFPPCASVQKGRMIIPVGRKRS